MGQLAAGSKLASRLYVRESPGGKEGRLVHRNVTYYVISSLSQYDFTMNELLQCCESNYLMNQESVSKLSALNESICYTII